MGRDVYVETWSELGGVAAGPIVVAHLPYYRDGQHDVGPVSSSCCLRVGSGVRCSLDGPENRLEIKYFGGLPVHRR
jgi:hypothetical protein